VEVPAYNGKLHSKFEVNCASHLAEIKETKVSFLLLLLFTQTQKQLYITRQHMLDQAEI